MDIMVSAPTAALKVGRLAAYAAFGDRVGKVGRPVERERPAPEVLAPRARRRAETVCGGQRLEVLTRRREALQLRPGCVRPARG